MERSFSDRIETDMGRDKTATAEDEERAQPERWLVNGAPDPEEPAPRLCQQHSTK